MRAQRRKSLVLIAGVCGSAALAALVPGVAQASPTSAPAAAWAHDWAREGRLVAAADDLRTRVRGAGSGFAGIAIDVDRGTVTLYVHGSLTPAQSALVTKANAAALGAGDGRVEVRAAAHGRDELDRAQRTLMDVSDEYGLQSVAVNEDGSGLTATVDTPTADMSAAFEGVAGVPVTVEQGSWAQATRQSDTAPFWGGARIQSGCTTAFGLHNSAGKTYIATASHCGNVGDVMKTGDGSHTFGTVSWDGASHHTDIELIPTNAGAYVYDGAWNNSSGYSKAVASWRRTVVGQSECASGSYSGAVCNIKVVQQAVLVSLKGYYVYQDVAEQQDHKAAWGNGDSGGPVFGLTSGAVKDIATGVITTYDTRSTYAAPCQGIPTSSSRHCAWRVGFARLGDLSDVIGVVVNTA